MDDIDLLAESIIELEDIKQEPDESVKIPVWNPIELIGSKTLKNEVKEDDDEELEPPVAIFLEETVKEEVEWEGGAEEQEESLLYGKELNVGFEKDRSSVPQSGVLVWATSNSSPEKSVGTTFAQSYVFSDAEAAHETPMNSGAQPPRYRPLVKGSAEGNLNVPEQNLTTLMYNCSECQESFTQRDHLTTHRWIHAWGKSHHCSFCQMSFKRLQNFVLHMRTHTGEKPYECLVCAKSFRGKCHLALHMRTHREEISYPCFVCKMNFRRKDDFDMHMQMHVGEISRRFHTQLILPKSVKPSEDLVTHTQTQLKERPHPCSVCEMKFKRKEHLANHMLLHSGQRPYPCSVCEMRFTRKDHLDRHMRLHTGERPHCCPYCQKSFIQRHGLVRHIRIHSKNTKSGCSVPNVSQEVFIDTREDSILAQCLRKVSNIQNLDLHMQTSDRT